MESSPVRHYTHRQHKDHCWHSTALALDIRLRLVRAVGRPTRWRGFLRANKHVVAIADTTDTRQHTALSTEHKHTRSQLRAKHSMQSIQLIGRVNWTRFTRGGLRAGSISTRSALVECMPDTVLVACVLHWRTLFRNSFRRLHVCTQKKTVALPACLQNECNGCTENSAVCVQMKMNANWQWLW